MEKYWRKVRDRDGQHLVNSYGNSVGLACTSNLTSAPHSIRQKITRTYPFYIIFIFIDQLNKNMFLLVLLTFSHCFHGTNKRGHFQKGSLSLPNLNRPTNTSVLHQHVLIFCCVYTSLTYARLVCIGGCGCVQV